MIVVELSVIGKYHLTAIYILPDSTSPLSVAALALLWLISGALTADLGNTLYPVGCNDVLRE